MKKVISLLVLAALLFSFVGCSKKDDTLTTQSLKVWCIQSSTTTDYKTNAQSKWMEKSTGIHVDYVDVPQSGWVDSFRNYIMSGESADIYLYDFDTSEVSAMSEMGAIIPLEDLIKEYAPNIQAMFDNNKDIVKTLTAPDGHIYTLFRKSNNQAEFTQKVYVNKDWLNIYNKATGNEMPATTDELRCMLEYFRDHDMNENGNNSDEIPMLGVNGVDGVYYLLGSFIPSNSSDAFGCYADDSGELKFAYNQEAFKDGLNFIKSLCDDGLYSPDSFTMDANSRYKYTSGQKDEVRVGVVSGVSLSSVVQLSNEEGTANYDSYIALPPVAGPNGVRTIVSRGTDSITMCGAISTSCKDTISAIKWLDKCFSEDTRMYSVYGGLETESWTYADGVSLNGEGKIIKQKKTSDNASWQGSRCITYRIEESDYLAMDATSIGTNDALATYRANLAYRPYAVEKQWPPIVWAGDNADLAEEYGNLYSAFVEVVTEYYTSVILGTKNLEGDWDAYINKLNSIGVDRFIELCNLYISK